MPRVCIHVNKQYQEQITLENRFQALQNLETDYEGSRQTATEAQTQGNTVMVFTGNTKQRPVSKQTANDLGKTRSIKTYFHPGWCGHNGQSKTIFGGQQKQNWAF